MAIVDRRTALVAGLALGGVPSVVPGLLGDAPTLVRDRLELPSGVQTGDVTTSSAVLWARCNREGRFHVRLSSNGRRLRSIRGIWADGRSDHVAMLELDDLAPGRDYEATVWFTNAYGYRSREETLFFRTAPIHPAQQSFVWTGDTCGQGWGINPDVGGMIGYRAMLEVRPDFMIHAGDHIYADETVEETVVEHTGDVWRNVMDESLTRPAQTLEDYRGRYRYVMQDHNVQEFYAHVPTVSMWDDHETANNWWPGLIYPDERYTVENNCDILAARGRRAFQEYSPIASNHLGNRGRTGFAERRIYRKVERGTHLDVFCLDMRSYRDENTLGLESEERSLLGRRQADWLIREVARSTATWKVIVNDLPLSVNGPARDTGLHDSYSNEDDGQPLSREHELARVLSAFKRHGVKNVVFLTADVHYTAAHHYHPDRASFTDFDPFWEFVSGPIQASTFGVKGLDGTFGGEIRFAKGNNGISQSPRAGNQFFGHIEIGVAGAMTVNLRNIGGDVLWSKTLDPEPVGVRPQHVAL